MPDASSGPQIQTEKPRTSGCLFVDLDGTLIRTDLFVESVLKLIKKNPINILRIIMWVLKGRSVAKALIARRIKLDPASLPFETELVDYIKQQKADGRRVVLATASHWTYARRIAAHLGLFDGVIATTAKDNLKGRRKLSKIKEYTGGSDFAYAGDSPADRPIWEEASQAVLVNAHLSMSKR